MLKWLLSLTDRKLVVALLIIAVGTLSVRYAAEQNKTILFLQVSNKSKDDDCDTRVAAGMNQAQTLVQQERQRSDSDKRVFVQNYVDILREDKRFTDSILYERNLSIMRTDKNVTRALSSTPR